MPQHRIREPKEKRVLEIFDGQQREQNRARYGGNRSHVDYVVRCHRKHGGRRGWVRSRLCALTL